MKLLFQIYPLTLSAFIVFTGCDSERISKLEHANDSLKFEILKRDHIIAAIENAHRILDSLQVPAGNPNGSSRAIPERVYDRLSAVVHYVKNSEKELNSVRKRLRNSEDQAIAYLMMADALKSEVGIRDGEIEGLLDSVTRSQSDYDGVFQNLQNREKEMLEVIQKIESKEKELSGLKLQVKGFLRNAEAEAYFMRAREVEEYGDKIIFASSKRRVTYQEALELYKKSFSLGKEEAQQRIYLLEKYFKRSNLAVAEVNFKEGRNLR